MPLLWWSEEPDGAGEPAHRPSVASAVQAVEHAICAGRRQEFGEVLGHTHDGAAAGARPSFEIVSENSREGGR